MPLLAPGYQMDRKPGRPFRAPQADTLYELWLVSSGHHKYGKPYATYTDLDQALTCAATLAKVEGGQWDVERMVRTVVGSFGTDSKIPGRSSPTKPGGHQRGS